LDGERVPKEKRVALIAHNLTRFFTHKRVIQAYIQTHLSFYSSPSHYIITILQKGMSMLSDRITAVRLISPNSYRSFPSHDLHSSVDGEAGVVERTSSKYFLQLLRYPMGAWIHVSAPTHGDSRVGWL
jgi:hypothetical protein